MICSRFFYLALVLGGLVACVPAAEGYESRVSFAVSVVEVSLAVLDFADETPGVSVAYASNTLVLLSGRAVRVEIGEASLGADVIISTSSESNEATVRSLETFLRSRFRTASR